MKKTCIVVKNPLQLEIQELKYLFQQVITEWAILCAGMVMY